MSDARDDNRSSSSSSAFSYTDAPRAAGSASSDDVADDDVDARRAPRVDTTTATMSAREQHGGAVTEAQGARAGERPFSLLSEPETPSNDDRPREPSAAAGAFARLAISEQQQSRTPRGTAAAAAAAAAAAEEVLESGTSSERWREVALDSNSAQAAHDGDEHEQEAAGELDSDRLAKALEMQEDISAKDTQSKRATMRARAAVRNSLTPRIGSSSSKDAFGGGASGDEAEDDNNNGLVDWDFWGLVMSDYEQVAATQPRKLSRAIQRGIPPALRGMTWQLMSAAKDPDLEELYGKLLHETSSHEKNIARDLSRTFPKHVYFRDGGGIGQENLFNVVKAYSLYDEEVGYTQGLQFIVGPLLLNMPDEEAFCVLVRLMKSYDLRSHYTPNMPGLQLRLFQFDRLVEELLPSVFMHLLRQGIKSSMYASQWILTLFGYRFPLELVSSVFDLVFAEGVEAIFRFALALLKHSEAHILELEFEDLVEYLKNGIFEVYKPDQAAEDTEPGLYNASEFVREALSVRITPLMLDQFSEEWDALCREQNAHSVEVDGLRRANQQLSVQVRQLEASLAQINQEHVDLVRQVVQSRLEREELENELVKVKLAFADLAHQQEAEQYRNSQRAKQQQRSSSNLSVMSADSSGGNSRTAPERTPSPSDTAFG